MKMKAISLWEPWASLIRTGAKTYETRSWATSYRGELLICASKKRDPEAMDIYLQLTDYQRGLQKLFGNVTDVKFPVMITEKNLNFGKAVAIVKLVDCLHIEKMNMCTYLKEECFGDFRPGRFAWKLEMVKNDFTPFPVKGAQGLFEVEV